MQRIHDCFEPPSDRSIKLWRYMDFAKFSDVLLNDRLFFPRACFLGDPFEGALAEPNLEMRRRIDELRSSIPSLSSQRHDDPNRSGALSSILSQIGEWKRKKVCVSCWHMNEYESAAMWSLYGKINESVCIQTNFERLSENLPDYANVGIVRYVDYDNFLMREGNQFNVFMYKRKSFEHERELRVVIHEDICEDEMENEINESASDFGISVKIDFSKAFDKIFISPQAPDWFKGVVEKLVSLKGIEIPVCKSSLAERAIY